MKAKQFIQLIEKNGWYFVRQTGSHKVFKHKDFPNNLSVPDHGAKDLKIGTLKKLLKDARIQQ